MKIDEPKHYWQTPYLSWASEIPAGWVVLTFYIRVARIKARVVAVVEAISLLWDLDAKALIGGPLSEHAGVFWLILPRDKLMPALGRLSRLGYVEAVDLLEPAESKPTADRDISIISQTTVRWKKKEYNLYRIYEENSQTLRQNAPDKRAFLLKTKDGEVRVVRGYRGSGDPFSRRGLPVYDARMLINLVSCGLGKNFLDPFAGVGGIILEAEVSGFRSVSLDIDPVLRYGLAQVSTIHCVSDAQDLPFSTATFDAIATEPPYHENAGPIIIPAFTEMYRVLKDGGRLAILCAGWQANALRREADKLNLVPYLDSFINRKGLDVVVLAWCKGQHQSSHGL